MGRFEERYELVRQLGSGAAGDVYLATVRETGAPVAVKFFRPEGDAIPQSKERFLQEAKVAAGIRNDYVVRVLDAGVTGDRHFFAMEYAEGADLHDFLVEHGPLEQEHCAELARKMAEGVAAIHAAGVVHRDLKPANVILVDPHTPKIADFGLARFTGGSRIRTKTGVILGTPGYLGPELLLGKELTTAADVYALGMIVFFLYEGDSPFGTSDFGKLLQAQTQGLPPTSFQCLPREVALMVMRMTALEPEERPSAAEVVELWKGGARAPGPGATAVLSRSRGDAPEATKVSAAPGAKALSMAPVAEPPAPAEGGGAAPGLWLRALPGVLVLLLGMGWLAWPGGEPAPPAAAGAPAVVDPGGEEEPPGPERAPADRSVAAHMESLRRFTYAGDLPGLLGWETRVATLAELQDRWGELRAPFVQGIREEGGWYGAWEALRPLLMEEWWLDLPDEEPARSRARELRQEVLRKLVELERLDLLDGFLGGPGGIVEGVSAALAPVREVLPRYELVGRGDQDAFATEALDDRCLLITDVVDGARRAMTGHFLFMPKDSRSYDLCPEERTDVARALEAPFDGTPASGRPGSWVGWVMGLRELRAGQLARLELVDGSGLPQVAVEVPWTGLNEFFLGVPGGAEGSLAREAVPRLLQVRVRGAVIAPEVRHLQVRHADLLAPLRGPANWFLLGGLGRRDDPLPPAGG